MEVSNVVNSMVRVRITGGSNERLLTTLVNQGIVLSNVRLISPIETELTFVNGLPETLITLIEKTGSQMELLDKGRYSKIIDICRNKRILIIGVLAYLLLTLYLPTKVLFIRINGDFNISKDSIMDAVSDYGIYFGASRKAIRNEIVKNGLLSRFRELEWVGVNTYGCVADIYIRGRNAVQTLQAYTGVCNIVADRKGIVEDIVVTKGTAKCKVGDIVIPGQVLVSGYLESDFAVKTTVPEAEIYAKTERFLQVVKPLTVNLRIQRKEFKRNFSLLFGKKQINLYKDSSNVSNECVKIFNRYDLTLPGGFVLPVGVITETLIFYSTEAKIIDEQSARSMAVDSAERYLKKQMVAGSILDTVVDVEQQRDALQLHINYICREMIGKDYYEEFFVKNE